MDKIVDKKLQKFFEKYKKIELKSGTSFIEPDVVSKSTYLLVTGKVRFYSLTKDGVDLTLNIFKPFSYFPIGSLINNSPNKYTYEAIAKSTLYVAPNQEVLNFIKSNPDVLLDLLQRVFTGLDGYFQKMETLMGGSAYTKIITDLVIYALRFGKKEESEKSYVLNITHSQLATLSGLSRETVTREIGNLTTKGLIQHDKNGIRIKDIDILSAEINKMLH